MGARLGSKAAVLALAGLVGVAGLGVAPAARAQEPSTMSLAQAREEFRRGMALEAAGDWEGALVVFRGVALVKSTPQVRFHIAQAEEKTGDLVGALGSYRLAAYEATEAKIKDVKVASEAAVQALEPRIPKLTIHRGTGAGVAKVVLDGRELGPASIGAPISVNPGPHHIEGSARGHETVMIDVTVAAAETKDVGLALPELRGAAAAGPVAPVDKPAAEAPSRTSPLKIAGFVVGGAGVASLIVAGVFLGVRQSAISDLDKACGADKQTCPANLASTNDSGKTASTVFSATAIAGGVLVAGGVTLLLIAPSSKPRPTVGLAMSPEGLALRGAF